MLQKFVHINPSTYGYLVREITVPKGFEVREEFVTGHDTFTHYSWRCSPSDFPSIPNDGPFPLSVLESSDMDVWASHGPLPENPRGIVVLAPPFGRVSTQLMKQLHRSGWAVLLLNYSTSCKIDPTSVPIEEPQSRGEFCAPEHSDALAIEQDSSERYTMAWAGALDNLVGATAPGIHDLILELERIKPQYHQVPIVIIGLSLGAIQAPAIATLLPRPPAAMVLIGGGANFPAIASESDASYFPEVIEPFLKSLRQTRGGTNAVLDQMLFDPYHLAPALREIPTLMIHAENDGIVPAKYGDLLWERLGRPERWVGNFGHIWLFLNLPTYSQRIIDWLEQHVPAPAPQPMPQAPQATP